MLTTCLYENMLDVFCQIKHIIKIKPTTYFYFFNVTTRTLKITYVACLL